GVLHFAALFLYPEFSGASTTSVTGIMRNPGNESDIAYRAPEKYDGIFDGIPHNAAYQSKLFQYVRLQVSLRTLFI
ncbi:hypothetical protein LJC15_05785, partial [Desulfovibrio sp. OttesenSCG-928-G11]|nr:hypothetical protein [Desulfovibrio sp. OttesenSCG-928-G11]